MGDYQAINSLMEKGAYKEAAHSLDVQLRNLRNDDYLWYLRGLVSLRLKNYEFAHECFLRAIAIDPKPVYHKMNGLAHLEQFELDEASEFLLKAQDGSDVGAYVFLAISYILSDTPGSGDLIKKAYSINKPKTVQILSTFYHTFFKNNPFVNDASKEAIERKLGVRK